jgi:nitrogen fixation-related uncharacterized protein
MTRIVVVVALVAMIVGGTAGYLWWGVPAGQQSGELEQARHRAEAAAEALAKAREELQATRSDLERERGMRARLEQVVTERTK